LELAAEFCQLEELAGDGRLDGAAALIEGVEREFAIARILYRAERQRYAAPD
nr:Hpt domain-containing protein [Pseudomonas sp.]